MQDERGLKILACGGLAIGGTLGLVGTLAPSASMRGLAWGLDGVALVIAAAVLAVHFLRVRADCVAAGFLVFAIGQGLILSGAAMDLAASRPGFGAGAGLWAAGLALVSIPARFPVLSRIVGATAALLLAATALSIFAGVDLDPTSSPLPFFAYPVMVATFASWIWALMSGRVTSGS